jgi:hypothetical protein
VAGVILLIACGVISHNNRRAETRLLSLIQKHHRYA